MNSICFNVVCKMEDFPAFRIRTRGAKTHGRTLWLGCVAGHLPLEGWQQALRPEDNVARSKAPERRTEIGIQTLTLGYTKDLDLAERVARAARVQELVVRICPKSGGIVLNQRERSHWLGRGWRLERAVAQKTLIEHQEKWGRRGQRGKQARMQGAAKRVPDVMTLLAGTISRD